MRRSLAELVSVVARQRDHGLGAVAQPLNLVQDAADLAVRPRDLRAWAHSIGSSILERFHDQTSLERLLLRKALLTHRGVVGLAQDEPVHTIIALEPFEEPSPASGKDRSQGILGRRSSPDCSNDRWESSEGAAQIPARVGNDRAGQNPTGKSRAAHVTLVGSAVVKL